MKKEIKVNEYERYVNRIVREKVETSSLDDLPLEMQKLTFSEATELKGNVKNLINDPVEVVYIEQVLILED